MAISCAHSEANKTFSFCSGNTLKIIIMLKITTSHTASRLFFCLWVLCAMSLLSAGSFVKDVPGSLSPESTRGCQLKNTSLGSKATCTHLDLKSVPQDLPSNTVMLDLSFNKITTLFNSSFAYLPDITTLGLASNVLSKIENGTFKPLAHLSELNLYNNRLVSLPSGLFCTNHFLSRLILSKNRLSSFPSDSLPWSNSIKKLDLSGNNISFIDSRDFKPLQNCSLERLQLDSNALR